MATKTISVDLEAYERLRAARSEERESFSKVIKRAVWPAPSGTAAELLHWRKESTVAVEKSVLDRLDAAQESDAENPDKWAS
ncbi:MAG: antitoxin VapB family protein [Akkermansiaceae bacterium]